MTADDLAGKLKMKNGFLSIKRVNLPNPPLIAGKGCSLGLLQKAFAGETLYFSAKNLTCPGASAGFGLADGLPEIPGGFGHFISCGRGEGFPPGERVKCSPDVGERMFLGQPQNVTCGFDTIRVKPYERNDGADTVTALVTPDQLSALVHLFCFRKAEYDNVIAPMISGCASVFRVPFGELKRDEPRAAIGNIDIFSRPHFAADTFFFTVSGGDFGQMLADAGESVLVSAMWKGVR
jgi:hypothetical protein